VEAALRASMNAPLVRLDERSLELGESKPISKFRGSEVNKPTLELCVLIYLLTHPPLLVHCLL
jgi:hypothetical protein